MPSSRSIAKRRRSRRSRRAGKAARSRGELPFKVVPGEAAAPIEPTTFRVPRRDWNRAAGWIVAVPGGISRHRTHSSLRFRDCLDRESRDAIGVWPDGAPRFRLPSTGGEVGTPEHPLTMAYGPEVKHYGPSGVTVRVRVLPDGTEVEEPCEPTPVSETWRHEWDRVDNRNAYTS